MPMTAENSSGLRGALEELRQSEQRYRTLFEFIEEVFCIVEVIFDAHNHPCDYRFLQVNHAFQQQTGFVSAVGKTMRELAPHHEQYWFEIYGRVALTGEPARFENLAAPGYWYDVSAVRVGRPEQRQVAVLFRDVSTQHDMESALQQNEQRLATVIDSLPVAVGVVDLQGKVVLSNSEMKRFMPNGLLPSVDKANVGRWTAQDDQGQPAASHDFPGARALRGERVVPGIEMLYAQPDGAPFWTQVAAAPIRSAGGDVAGQVIVVSDIDTIKRTQSALRQSEERLRQFGDASTDVLWFRDAETLNWEYLTPAFEEIYGMPRSEALTGNNFRNWAAMIVPEDREQALDHIRRVRSGESANFEYRIRRPDGEIRWLRDTDFPILDESGKIVRIGGIGHDITEAKLGQQHERLLLAELQHRVRNTLAVMRSILRRTAQNSLSIDDYTAHLDGRINAFARVQGAVTRDPIGGVDLLEIVSEELLATGARDGGQLTIDGGSLKLSHKAAEMMALVVHELATNAVKYGALTVSRGHIRVYWREVDEQLVFSWTESGLSGLLPPQRRGFGVDIIEGAMPYELGADVDLAIKSTGLRMESRIPLDRISPEPSIAAAPG